MVHHGGLTKVVLSVFLVVCAFAAAPSKALAQAQSDCELQAQARANALLEISFNEGVACVANRTKVSAGVAAGCFITAPAHPAFVICLGLVAMGDIFAAEDCANTREFTDQRTMLDLEQALQQCRAQQEGGPGELLPD